MKPWLKLWRLRRNGSFVSVPRLTRGLAYTLLLDADEDGFLAPASDDPIGGVCRSIGVPPKERRAVRRRLAVLLEDGFLEHTEDGVKVAGWEQYQPPAKVRSGSGQGPVRVRSGSSQGPKVVKGESLPQGNHAESLGPKTTEEKRREEKRVDKRGAKPAAAPEFEDESFSSDYSVLIRSFQTHFESATQTAWAPTQRTKLEQVTTRVRRQAEMSGSSFEEVLEKVLLAFFVDEWAMEKRFPLGHLINNFAAILEPKKPKAKLSEADQNQVAEIGAQMRREQEMYK